MPKSIKIPKQLPDCLLLRNLLEKAAQRRDTEFDFSGHLISFKEQVTGEIQNINLLFP